ncbi:hypothetical protein F5Y18DRAFT_352114 [Xylariaceae sp. FL1019]|nr:hypothetical protein F5Y18DRAFT_352114 [Xylariaceae sp. FL1019]
MGKSSQTQIQIPSDRQPQLDSRYDKLCEYVQFGVETKEELREILDGPQVRPYFREYRKHYLEPAKSRPKPVEYVDLYNFLHEAECFTRCEYTGPVKARDKADWSAMDHAARFLVRVLEYSWKNGGLWESEGYDPDDEDQIFEAETYQVWTVLQFLQAEWEAVNRPGWEVDRMNSQFQKVLQNEGWKYESP